MLLIKWDLFCCHVSTAVWMYHLDSNEMHGGKARWEPHKNVMCCFEQFLEKHSTKQLLFGYLRPISQTIHVR